MSGIVYYCFWMTIITWVRIIKKPQHKFDT